MSPTTAPARTSRPLPTPRCQERQRDDGLDERQRIAHRRQGELSRDDGDQAHRGDVDSVEERPSADGRAQPVEDRDAQPDGEEGGQEDADRRRDRTGRSADEVADEGRGREQRPGGRLSDRDRVEQLPLGQPAEPVHQLRPQQRDEHIATAEEHGSDLQRTRGRSPGSRPPQRQQPAQRPTRTATRATGRSHPRHRAGPHSPATSPSRPAASSTAISGKPPSTAPIDATSSTAVPRCPDRRPGDRPPGMSDHRDDDRRDPDQQRLDLRTLPILDVEPGESRDDQDGR